MASDLTRISISEQQAATELELLQVLLSDDVYPWDMTTENGHQQYLETIESEWTQQLSEDDNAAIAKNGQAFFHQLNQAWADVESSDDQSTTIAETSVNALQRVLFDNFQDRVPADLIQSLTEKASQLASQPISLAEQLVQSVQDILPEWGTEDLHVLARPYAFAMRGPDTDKLEVALRSVRYAAWTELSGVEQARLSLAIARYTLSQMPDNPTVNR